VYHCHDKDDLEVDAIPHLPDGSWGAAVIIMIDSMVEKILDFGFRQKVEKAALIIYKQQ